jgi:hypothetical protein
MMRQPLPADLGRIPRRGYSGGWRVTTSPVVGTYSRVPSRFAPVGELESGVIYLADSAETALSEYFSSTKVVGIEAFEDRVLLEVNLGHGYSLADLGANETYQQLDVDGLTRNSVYDDSQELATRLIQAGYDGIAYPTGRPGGGRLLAFFGHVGINITEKAELRVRAVEFGDAEKLGIAIVGPAQAAT